MLGIVIGLSLVSTVATTSTSASTALAAFSGAQALVIIVPLIFVAIILLYAYSHASKAGGHVLAVSLEMRGGARLLMIVAYSANRLVVAVARLAATQISHQ
jgi:hypothetical protein